MIDHLNLCRWGHLFVPSQPTLLIENLGAGEIGTIKPGTRRWNKQSLYFP
jgi:hypothetical protein